MHKEQEKISLSLLNDLNSTGAGYNLLRYISLPDLFGNESPTILYFMGKELARNLDISYENELHQAFEKLGWGQLVLVKDKKKYITFTLTNDAVFHRLEVVFNVDFRLEAGFIAESIQLINGTECECVETINQKKHNVEFKVYYTE